MRRSVSIIVSLLFAERAIRWALPRIPHLRSLIITVISLVKLFLLFQLFITLYFVVLYDFVLPLCGEINIIKLNIGT